MNKEEVTLKGNRILIAIGKGQLGVDADELKKCQKAYLNIDKMGSRFGVVIMGNAILILAGLALLISGPAIMGVVMIGLGGIMIGSLFGQRKNAKRFLDVIAACYTQISPEYDKVA